MYNLHATTMLLLILVLSSASFISSLYCWGIYGFAVFGAGLVVGAVTAITGRRRLHIPDPQRLWLEEQRAIAKGPLAGRIKAARHDMVVALIAGGVCWLGGAGIAIDRAAKGGATGVRAVSGGLYSMLVGEGLLITIAVSVLIGMYVGRYWILLADSKTEQ